MFLWLSISVQVRMSSIICVFVCVFLMLLASLLFRSIKTFHHPIQRFRYEVEQGEIEKHLSPLEN